MQESEYFPNPAIADDIEVIRTENLGSIIIGFRVDQHTAQYRFLSLAIMRLGLDSTGIGFLWFKKILHAKNYFLLISGWS